MAARRIGCTAAPAVRPKSRSGSILMQWPCTTIPAQRECCRARPSPLCSGLQMLKTFSLSLLFILTLGILIAAYAGLPA